ncbi:uncharacterized protein [Epargyreus clarus]|uniref:uncharacterized protein isoform X2 n=1 Tax=Epargyreus clarus TaxID=520877 RepID=UPI003C2BEE0F
MPNPLLNFCYNIVAKREKKKKMKEDRNYATLSGSASHPGVLGSADSDEESDTCTRTPKCKMSFWKKIFKTKAKNSDEEASTSSAHDTSKRYEASIEKMKAADVNVPEIKIATLEAIQENKITEEQQLLNKSAPRKKDSYGMPIQANVSYEGLDGVFATPVGNDNVGDAPEGEIHVDAAYDYVPQDFATNSDDASELLFDQPQMEYVFGDDYEESQDNEEMLGAYNEQLIEPLEEAPPGFQDWHEITPYEPLRDDEMPEDNQYVDDDTRRMIADFFAQNARILDEYSIDTFANYVEIANIDVTEEELTKYHHEIKGTYYPISLDRALTTAEVALNFVEKLMKAHEEKMQAKEREEEDEEYEEYEEEVQKPKTNEVKKKPRLWLVFNRATKEQVIICTPPDYSYDSD